MMMSEHYVAVFKQKLARKEATNWNWDVWKVQILAFKCAKEIEKRDWHVAKQIWWDEITTKNRFDEQWNSKQCGKVGDVLHLTIKANLHLVVTAYHTTFCRFTLLTCKYTCSSPSWNIKLNKMARMHQTLHLLNLVWFIEDSQHLLQLID